jgi:arylsulfatase A-like enzyme
MKFKTTFTALLLLFVSNVAISADSKPNILLIYVDDLGYGDMGVYGHPVIKTPNLDKLAGEGLMLTNYYAPSALCSPSRAGLLTGRTPYRSGIKSWIPEDSGVYLSDEELTLAELLKGQGYDTALIGKWHLNSDLASTTEPQPTDQGFDYAYGHNAFQIPTNFNPTNIFRNGEALGEVKGYTAELYASEAIGWLDRQPAETPFFLFLSMAEPHTVFENPPEYNEQYSDYTRGEIIPITQGPDGPPKDKLIARGPGEYYANITYMDAQLGRVIKHLDTLGKRENTIIVFLSDNGPVTSAWRTWWEVNAYGSTGGLKGRKHYLYEGGIKVQGLFVYPGVVEAGTISDQAVVGMDMFVTLAEMAGAGIPADRPIDGISIEPIFKGEELEKRTLFWALPTDIGLEFAIREDMWKLHVDEDMKPRELYRLDEDPLELFNLISVEVDRVKHLQALMATTLESINNDPLLPGSP